MHAERKDKQFDFMLDFLRLRIVCRVGIPHDAIAVRGEVPKPKNPRRVQEKKTVFFDFFLGSYYWRRDAKEGRSRYLFGKPIKTSFLDQ
jgi:hypothetical protein